MKKNIALMRRSKVCADDCDDHQEGMKHLKEKRERDPNYIPTEDERIQEILMEGSYPRLLTNRQVFMACLLYGMLSLVQGGHDALYPVWMINPVEVKGFDWTQSEVGMLYSMLGPIQMVSGHILPKDPYPFLHHTRSEQRRSPPAHLQGNVAHPGLAIHVHHPHHSHRRVDTLHAPMGDRFCFLSPVGPVVCDLRHLCSFLRCAYSSVHRQYRHDLECRLSRLPRESQRNWAGLRIDRAFHRMEGVCV